MKLRPGKFYRSRCGEVWCCYRVRLTDRVHARARCVEVEAGRIEYFYADGRYDEAGLREHNLIEEIP